MDGFNVLICAYGQTGSGKTYTMDATSEDVGIMHLAVREILQEIKGDLRKNVLGMKYELSVSV